MKLALLVSFVAFFCNVESLQNFNKNHLPSSKNCGLQIESKQKSSGVGEYPWLAFIPVEPRKPPVFPDALRCAGVLISKRYVLTSIHCFQFHMTKVRLGQFNSMQNVTCSRMGCDPVVEVDIEDKFGFEDVNIGVLRLAEDVKFSRYIQPICLPFDSFPKAQLGEAVYTSGWGEITFLGEYSFIPKKVKQSIVNNEECSKLTKIDDKDGFMCLQYDRDSNDIPCRGDDGSPIMYRSSTGQMVLEGILPHPYCVGKNVSEGIKISGDFLKWLVEEKMRP